MLRVARASVLIGNRAILDDVSLRLAPGSVTAIIGPNGAGKSTLLGVCSGTLKPNPGSVHIGETELRELSVKEAARRRAVMPQDVTVAFPFTVRDVVAMGRTPWGTPAKEDADIVTATLQQCELEEFAEREITSLSGGERARAALARVIAQATPITRASVILLDEPTAAMDIARGGHEAAPAHPCPAGGSDRNRRARPRRRRLLRRRGGADVPGKGAGERAT